MWSFQGPRHHRQRRPSCKMTRWQRTAVMQNALGDRCWGFEPLNFRLSVEQVSVCCQWLHRTSSLVSSSGSSLIRPEGRFTEEGIVISEQLLRPHCASKHFCYTMLPRSSKHFHGKNITEAWKNPLQSWRPEISAIRDRCWVVSAAQRDRAISTSNSPGGSNQVATR